MNNNMEEKDELNVEQEPTKKKEKKAGKTGKRILATVCFLAVLGFAFYILNTTLQVKYEDGVLSMQDFYEYPENSIDVILLGSSHLGSNIDPTQLYSEYGIAAYNLWGSAQPTWNTYYYLKEALKYQKPKVVVLETYVVAQDNETTGYGTLIKSTSGMKLSEDKYADIQSSIDNFDDIGMDVFLGWPTYHTRYGELEALDFNRYLWNFQLGDKKVSSWSHIACEANDVSGVTDLEPLVAKHEKYFRAIIDLCKENDIQLMLFTAPYIVSEKEQMRFNTIASIAKEEGLFYENYNLTYDNFGLDYTTDFADALGHMNDSGIAKITSYLGESLTENYELPKTTGNKWFMEQEDTTQSYQLASVFKGDGESSYIDTGVTLYENPYSSWTILADITSAYGDEKEGIYFSCFNEDPASFGGLLVRKVNDKLNVVVGSNYSVDIDVPLGDHVLLAITKDKESYTINVNGEDVQANWEASYGTSYTGNLMIGCELDENRDPYRFSTGQVNSMEVYSDVWGRSRITSWMNLQKRNQVEREGTVQVGENGLLYRLPGKFVGNGTSTYIDTGIPLYEDVDQDWSILMDFNTICESDNKVFLSCFDEGGSNYRGILIRQDEDVLNVIVGNAYYYGIPMYEDHYARLAIVKEGDYYTIYANGTLLVSKLEAACNEPYDGTLLIGAEESNGEKFRISAVTFNRMEVYDRALDSTEIVDW